MAVCFFAHAWFAVAADGEAEVFTVGGVGVLGQGGLVDIERWHFWIEQGDG